MEEHVWGTNSKIMRANSVTDHPLLDLLQGGAQRLPPAPPQRLFGGVCPPDPPGKNTLMHVIDMYFEWNYTVHGRSVSPRYLNPGWIRGGGLSIPEVSPLNRLPSDC